MKNKDIAYLCGVIIGDGNITISERKKIFSKRYRISIFNKSEKFLTI
jgi:hypothetical protein